jgi:hypothetical protein
MLKKTTNLFLSLCICFFFQKSGFAEENSFIKAAKFGDVEKVEALLKADPTLINTTDGEIGATALHWALIYGKKEVIKAILAYHPDVNRAEKHNGTPMHWAAHFDDAENVRWLLDRGAKIDHINQYGRTPLLVAARRGCVNVAKLLLQRGADINARVKNGNSALHIAAANGHSEIIDLFIASGLDPNSKNNAGQTYKDVLFVRPRIVKIDSSLYAQYAGLYTIPEGPQLHIHLENGKLFIYAFGKDELHPISETRFITSAEVEYFEFARNEEEKAMELVFNQGNMEIRLKKSK